MATLFEVAANNLTSNRNISLYFPCYQGKQGETGSLWTACTANSTRFEMNVDRVHVTQTL